MGDLELPGRRDRIIASTVSAFVAVVLFIVSSLVLGAISVFLFDRQSIGLAASAQAEGGSTLGQAAAAADSRIPAWVSLAVLVASALVAWLGASRLGLGLMGDAAGSVRALGPDGGRASRGRTLARAGMPVLLGMLGILVGLGPTVVVVLLVCAAVAAYRADRRGPFELLSGVRLESTTAVRIDREEWREHQRATRIPAQPDELTGPDRPGPA